MNFLIFSILISLTSAFDYQISAQLSEEKFKPIEKVTFNLQIPKDGTVFKLEAERVSSGSIHFQLVENASFYNFEPIEKVYASFDIENPSKLFPEFIYLKSLNVIHYKENSEDLIQKIYMSNNSSILINRKQIIELKNRIEK